MKRSQGFTIIEVMVAIVIIAIGIAGTVGLQLTSLRTTREARQINDVTRFVKNELEWHRHTSIEFDETTITGCASPRGTLPDGFETCTVTVEPCAIDFTATPNTLVCGSTATPAAYRITVSVADTNGNGLTLATLNTGVFVSGSASEVLE